MDSQGSIKRVRDNNNNLGINVGADMPELDNIADDRSDLTHASIHGGEVNLILDAARGAGSPPLRSNTFVSRGTPKSSRPGANGAGSVTHSIRKIGSFIRGSQAALMENVNKLSLSKTDRKPNLPEKISVINKWFASCGNGKNFKQFEVSIERIAELFVQKQLVSDTDTGIKTIMKNLNIREVVDNKEFTLDFALFQRIFIRRIFKESLVEVLREIEEGVQRQAQPGQQSRLMANKSPTLRNKAPIRREFTMQSMTQIDSAMQIVHEMSQCSSEASFGAASPAES
mmetsp:Transcript_25779/g.32082  ORF Transcript_25779/g.32082 Transcript_25779/m.32082 type:complete len:285 (+) Transcript_25779:558-1412(+)